MNRDKTCRRSDCPLSVALEIFGDKWTLLVLRDLLLKGHTSFKQFQESGEGIATNVLSDRLRRLQEEGIVVSERSESDARVVKYAPTIKGLDLLPVLIEVVLWSARYEKTAAPPALLKAMTESREAFIRRIRDRFPDAR